MADISLLPDDARKREEQLPDTKKTDTMPSEGLKMHIPETEADEDIEIIEVDEGDLGSVLADEPFFTRFMYRASALVEQLRRKLSSQDESDVPPPKLPPQFFTPPRAGGAAGRMPPGVAEAMNGRPGAPGSKARITPSADVPRRVRVIKRVRKPVQVSLISAEDVMAYHVDVPKRRWTLVMLTLLFSALIGGGYWLLDTRTVEATTTLAEIERQIGSVDERISKSEEAWVQYRDLQRRLTSLGALMDEHVVVSRAFELLEQRTLPSVAYRSAALSAGNTLTLDVVTDSYQSAAQQLVAFRSSPMVSRADATLFSAQVDGESGDASLISFQLVLELQKNALRDTPLVANTETPAP